MEKIFVLMVVIAAVINLALTIGVPLIALGINFVFRSDLNGWCYQELKEDKLGWYSYHSREENIFFLDIVTYIAVAVFVAFLLKEAPALLTSLVYITAFLLTLPLLRWLVDVARNLSIKKDTGDSKKLEQMQSEIDSLKQNLNK